MNLFEVFFLFLDDPWQAAPAVQHTPPQFFNNDISGFFL